MTGRADCRRLSGAANQPACFLQLVGELGMGCGSVALKQLGVHPVDAHAWQHGGVDGGDPFPLDPANDDIGDDIAGVRLAEAPSGVGIEAADELICGADLLRAGVQPTLEPDEVSACE